MGKGEGRARPGEDASQRALRLLGPAGGGRGLAPSPGLSRRALRARQDSNSRAPLRGGEHGCKIRRSAFKLRAGEVRRRGCVGGAWGGSRACMHPCNGPLLHTKRMHSPKGGLIAALQDWRGAGEGARAPFSLPPPQFGRDPGGSEMQRLLADPPWRGPGSHNTRPPPAVLQRAESNSAACNCFWVSQRETPGIGTPARKASARAGSPLASQASEAASSRVGPCTSCLDLSKAAAGAGRRLGRCSAVVVQHWLHPPPPRSQSWFYAPHSCIKLGFVFVLEREDLERNHHNPHLAN